MAAWAWALQRPKAGADPRMNLLLQHFLERSSRLFPEVVAVDDGQEKLTYTQLSDRVDALCQTFTQHGLIAGQHLAVFSTNNADYVAIYFACAKLGLVIVPMNAHLKADEIDWILKDCKPTAVVVESTSVARFSKALESAGMNDSLRYELGSSQHEWVSLDDLHDGADRKDQDTQPPATGDTAKPDARGNDLAIQMYTSGTTGKPKGVMLSHHNMTSLVSAWLLEMPLKPDSSRLMQATPLFHVGGLLVCLSTIASGATLILLPKFEAELARETLTNKAVTTTLLVPSMIQRVLALPGIEQTAFPHLQTMVYGASLMPLNVLRKAHQVFECDFLQGYGLTETSGVALCLRPSDHDFSADSDHIARLSSAGKELRCCEVRVVDTDFVDVTLGDVGEIVVRGSNVMQGYWNNPEANSETLINGWLRTGDLGKTDDDGYIYIVGRLKDMIDYCGENVYPAEVESVLEQNPDIDEVAVIGLPQQTSGEEVVAIIVISDAANTSEDSATAIIETSRELCNDRLANFKCPARYIVADELPRTPAGKVMKHVLRALHS